MSGELTHVVEALLFVSAEPLTVAELATAAEAPPERVERALDALAERHAEGRSGVVLERVAGVATGSAPRRRPPTRARGSCSVRPTVRSRPPRSRRWR